MKKIVTMLQPFTINQNIIVYENGNKIDLIEVNMDNINEAILNLVEKYNIKQIDFVGAKQYAKGIGNQLEKSELVKFGKSELEINYL
ncbi:MAG: hypothetical protein ACI4PE_02950 [Bacilli bacterium]